MRCSYSKGQLDNIARDNYEVLRGYCELLEKEGYWDGPKTVMNQSIYSILDMYVQTVLLRLALYCGRLRKEDRHFIANLPESNIYDLSEDEEDDARINDQTERFFKTPPILLQLCGLRDVNKESGLLGLFFDALMNIQLSLAFQDSAKTGLVASFIKDYYTRIEAFLGYGDNYGAIVNERYIFKKLCSEDFEKSADNLRKCGDSFDKYKNMMHLVSPAEMESKRAERRARAAQRAKRAKEAADRRLMEENGGMTADKQVNNSVSAGADEETGNQVAEVKLSDGTVSKEESQEPQTQETSGDTTVENEAAKTHDNVPDASVTPETDNKPEEEPEPEEEYHIMKADPTKQYRVYSCDDDYDEFDEKYGYYDENGVLVGGHLENADDEITYEEEYESEWSIDVSSGSSDVEEVDVHSLSQSLRFTSRENRETSAIRKVLGTKEEETNTLSSGDELDRLLKELDDLVGLDAVKEEVKSLINLIKVRALRKKHNMPLIEMSFHMVFTGNPGTGKTTVARLIAGIYRELGLLSKGQLIESDRSGLVAGYVGQTAIKVREVVEKALGGVLFIDEAYSLKGNAQNDFGDEAIETLVKLMEDHRDDLVVIVAGYNEEMHEFLKSNTGLTSRFNKFINFADYTTEELILIMDSMTSKAGFKMSPEAKAKVVEYVEGLDEHARAEFGNARGIRNLFERVVVNQANRISRIPDPQFEDLELIMEEDI